jgi:excisionase family DNA binding protein
MARTQKVIPIRPASPGPAHNMMSSGSEGNPKDRAEIQPLVQDPKSSPLEVGTPLLASDRLVLSVAEAGDLLGLSKAFAYELVARGELPVVRFGRRIVVPKAALLELLRTVSSSTT